MVALTVVVPVEGHHVAHAGASGQVQPAAGAGGVFAAGDVGTIEVKHAYFAVAVGHAHVAEWDPGLAEARSVPGCVVTPVFGAGELIVPAGVPDFGGAGVDEVLCGCHYSASCFPW